MRLGITRTTSQARTDSMRGNQYSTRIANNASTANTYAAWRKVGGSPRVVESATVVTRSRTTASTIRSAIVVARAYEIVKSLFAAIRDERISSPALAGNRPLPKYPAAVAQKTI